MKLFLRGKKYHDNRRILISILIFVLVVWLFFFGLSFLTTTADAEQLNSLQSTITKSVIHSYCVDGYYPESLSAIKDSYGISYDTNKFYVDYRPLGQNIMPQITVIQKTR